MLIDCVLTACNENPLYIDFIPIFIKAWKKHIPGIDVKIILIANDIPDRFKIYSDNIILFPPIDNISTAFTGQYIRLLYPGILPYKNGVLITDMDMLPMSGEYYTENIKNIDDNKFVYYRDVLLDTYQEIAMCYNVATPKTWSSVFKINTLQDIIIRLQEKNSTIQYEDRHGGSGWSTDQKDFYKFIMDWNNETQSFIYLKDSETGYRRLDRDEAFYYNRNIRYSDYHALRPYSKYKEINDSIFT